MLFEVMASLLLDILLNFAYSPDFGPVRKKSAKLNLGKIFERRIVREIFFKKEEMTKIL